MGRQAGTQAGYQRERGQQPTAASPGSPSLLPKNLLSDVDYAALRSSHVQEPGNSGSLPNRMKEYDMRVMVLVKANPETEAGVMPSEQMLTEMGRFNEELVKAGVMLAGEGLHPT